MPDTLRPYLLPAAATFLWLVVVLLVWLLTPDDGAASGTITGIVVTLLPIGLIWTSALALRALRTAEDETRRLQFALDSLRQNVLADRQARSLGAVPPMPADTPRPAPPQPQAQPQPRPEEQPRLALPGDSGDTSAPLTTEDLILALHFPDNDRDEAGFAALRRALKDRQTRQLVQASQDVLTLLSQDGIYMDDFTPDRAHPDVWRRFARGERGGAVTSLGGISDRDLLALAIARLREDAIFRDATHHFLRLFDKRLTAFEPAASDEEMALLAETRTARAFMLLGRVTGIFD